MADVPVTNFTATNGASPATCFPPGLQVGAQVAINGETDLSSIITCENPGQGAGGLVNWITLQPHSGIFPYQLQINGQGPAGIESGALELTFTDEDGDTYFIKLSSSSPYTHTLDYSSYAPGIVSIAWKHSTFG